MNITRQRKADVIYRIEHKKVHRKHTKKNMNFIASGAKARPGRDADHSPPSSSEV
jgi:hypothetical protein